MERASDVSANIQKEKSKKDNFLRPIKKIISGEINTELVVFPNGKLVAGKISNVRTEYRGGGISLLLPPSLILQIWDDSSNSTIRAELSHDFDTKLLFDVIEHDPDALDNYHIRFLGKISDHEVATADHSKIIFWDINRCKQTRIIKLPEILVGGEIGALLFFTPEKLLIAGRNRERTASYLISLDSTGTKPTIITKDKYTHITHLLKISSNELAVAYKSGETAILKLSGFFNLVNKLSNFFNNFDDIENNLEKTHLQLNLATRLLLSEDKKSLIIASRAGYIRILNISTWHDLVLKHSDSFHGVTDIVQLNNYLISSSLDKTIKIWDMQNGKCVQTLEMAEPINSLALLSENKLLCGYSHGVYQIQFPFLLSSLLELKKDAEGLFQVDISLSVLQHSVLLDNIPSSDINQELTSSELFNKALEESKKSYKQLLEMTTENFTKTIGQDKAALEKRLAEDEKQLKALEDYTKTLESELQKNNKRDEVQERKLRDLRIKLRILLKEHKIKEKEKRMLEKFKNSPNLFLYYRTIQICMQRLCISYLAGSGGKVTVEPGEIVDKTEEGIELFGDLCNIVPLVGPLVNFVLKWGIGKPLEKVDSARQENNVENISYLLTLTELKEISESIAQKLTNWYEPILQNFATIDDETQLREDKKKQGPKEKLKEGLKELKEEWQEAILNKKHKAFACKAAEFAVTWALEELEEDKFDPKRPL